MSSTWTMSRRNCLVLCSPAHHSEVYSVRAGDTKKETNTNNQWADPGGYHLKPAKVNLCTMDLHHSENSN